MLMFRKFFKTLLVFLVVSGVTVFGLVEVLQNRSTKTFNKTTQRVIQVEEGSEPPFMDGRLCDDNETSINCSRLFTSNLLTNIMDMQSVGLTSEFDKVNSHIFQVEVSFDKDIYLKKVKLPEISSDIEQKQFFRRKFTKTFLPLTIEKKSLINGSYVNEIEKNLDIMINDLINTSDNTTLYKIPNSTKLSFYIKGIDPRSGLNLEFDLLTTNASDTSINASVSVFPLFNSDELTPRTIIFPKQDSFVIKNKFLISGLNNTTATSYNLFPLANANLQTTFFNEALLKDDLTISESSYTFAKSMYNSLFKDKANGWIVPKDQRIDNFVLEGDFSRVPKDFLSLTGVRKLTIQNSFNLNNSIVTVAEWIIFFNANTFLTSIEIINTDLNDLGFETFRSAIESSSLGSLKLNLANNNLTILPTLSNSAIIKELNLSGNSLINVSAIENNYWNLESLDLSYNSSLVSKVPNFLVSLDLNSRITKLNLRGLNLASNTVALNDLQTKTIATNIKSRLEEIDLSYNDLTSTTKLFEQGNFLKLKNINLEGNLLEEISDDFWLDSTINDIELNLNNNPNLTINIDSSTHVLLKTSKLYLNNTGRKIFNSAITSTSKLKELYFGEDQDGNYDFVANLPNSLTTLVITKAPKLALIRDVFATKLEHLNQLTNLTIIDSSLEDDFLSVLKNNSNIVNLDLSKNQFGDLENIEDMHMINLEKLYLNDNDSSGININSLLLAFGTTSKLTKLEIYNSKLHVKQSNVNLPPLPSSKITSIYLNNPFSFYIDINTPFEAKDISSLVSPQVHFVYKQPHFDNDVVLDQKALLVNSLQREAQDFLYSIEQENHNYIVNTQSDTQNGVNLPSFQLPEITNQELNDYNVFASYLIRAKQSTINYNQNLANKMTLLISIKDLENQQNKVREQVEKLENDNKELLKTIDELNSGTLYQAIIALVACVLLFNLIFVIIFLVRYFKNKKKK